MDGELEQHEGRWRLRFTRRLRHPPQRVWEALTAPANLDAWFPTTIEGERAPGAALRFAHRGAEAPPEEGQMLRYEPPAVLEFRWGTDVLCFELRPDGDGTVLTLVDTIDDLGKAARDAAGWHECLDVLAHHLDGEAPPWSPGDRWAQVHPAYVEAFGPEAATIGPPGDG